MPIRMYDKVYEIDRKVYGFVYEGSTVKAVCYDKDGNFYTASAENLKPVD